MKSETQKLISNLKKEIEEIEKSETITQTQIEKFNFKKTQLQFAEKLIKAIKEDIENCKEPLFKSPEGNSNTYFLDYEKIIKILEGAVK